MKMNLGRQVKKLIGQNRYTLSEIARICNSTMEECSIAYENFMGQKIPSTFLLAGNKKQKDQLRTLILNNEKILLFGNHGVGKSSLPRLVANELGYRIIYSYPRNEEDLLKDFAQLPSQTRKTIFVVEGDSYYWRSYALINHYLKESINPFIIIVNKKDTIHSLVEKQLVKLKLQTPTKKDVEEFIKIKYPDWDGNIDDVYDSDMRITLRNIKYGFNSSTMEETEKINAQKVAYKIVTGNCTKEDIKNCEHPLMFILNWLGNNAHKFYDNLDVIDALSFVDANKFNYKKKYLNGVLLSIPKQEKRGKLSFPAIKYKPPKEKEEKWDKKKLKKQKPKEEKKQESILKFSSDMEL